VPETGAHLASSNVLHAVALPAASGDAFVGGNYGTMLRFDGTTSTWAASPARTSKDVRGFWFADGAPGYAACASGPNTSGTALGSVANSCFIGWR
jgi:hypothetical protein